MRKTWLKRVIAGSAVALAVLAAACGGRPASTGSGGSSNAGGSTNAQMLAFANCMRSNGVPKWPDPTSNGPFDKSKLTLQQLGVTNSQLDAAQRACRHLLPNGGNGPTHAQVQQYRNTMLQYARCMRAHGISNMPDPDSMGRLNIGPGTRVDVNTPQFQAARQVCLSKLSLGAGGSR